MQKIIIPTVEEIITINKKLGYEVVNKGSLDFILDKVKSLKKSGDFKKDVSKIGARLWMDIISDHPFVDGNKRTATETTKLFFKLNKIKLDIPQNGIIYLSLKIANKDINLNKLMSYIYERIKKE